MKGERECMLCGWRHKPRRREGEAASEFCKGLFVQCEKKNVNMSLLIRAQFLPAGKKK